MSKGPSPPESKFATFADHPPDRVRSGSRPTPPPRAGAKMSPRFKGLHCFASLSPPPRPHCDHPRGRARTFVACRCSMIRTSVSGDQRVFEPTGIGSSEIARDCRRHDRVFPIQSVRKLLYLRPLSRQTKKTPSSRGLRSPPSKKRTCTTRICASTFNHYRPDGTHNDTHSLPDIGFGRHLLRNCPSPCRHPPVHPPRRIYTLVLFLR